MKKLKVVLSLLVMAALFSSCGVSNAIILNHNQNSTTVQLSGANYKVVERIMGNSAVKYICMIGGINKTRLYENAYSDMMSKTTLVNTSRALTNIVTEEHIGGVPPFYFKRTVTVSAYVIEFTK